MGIVLLFRLGLVDREICSYFIWEGLGREGRGGRAITEGSTGSTPRDCAGGPSMRMSVVRVSGRKVEIVKEELTDPENLHGVEWVGEAEECAD